MLLNKIELNWIVMGVGQGESGRCSWLARCVILNLSAFMLKFIFCVLLCVTLKHTKVTQSDMKRRLDDTKWQISCEGFWFVFPALILKCTGTEESSVYSSFSSALVSPTCSLQDYMLQQTMLRVKDPARSLNFYTRILGMTWVLSLIPNFSRAALL